MAKQNETEREFAKLPACADEFIRLVIKKMRYRKKVRQDVQVELAAHFEDELKDLATDEEKAQKAQQLIAGFGDVKLLAVLLRRAKKRCRPLWRTAIVRTFQTVGVLIVCLVIYVVWFLSGKPVITTDYVAELNRIVRPAADETQNAGPLYLKAIELYEKVPEDISELLRKKYREATAEEKQLIEKWIKENSEALDLIIAGTQKPYYWQEYRTKKKESGMMGVLIPSLVEYRRLARALLWRGWLRAEQGRYQDALSDVKSCYCLGRHLKTGAFLVEQLVGFSIQNLATETCRGIVANHNVAPNTISKLQQDFGEMVAGEDFTVGLDAEKLSVFDEIQRSFTEGFRGGHLIPSRIAGLSDLTKIIATLSLDHPTGAPAKRQKPGWFSAFIANLRYEICKFSGFIYESGGSVKKAGYMLFLHPDKQQTTEMLDRYYAFWEKIVHKTPAQIRAEGIDTEKEAMEIVEGNILLEIFTPAISRIIELSHRNRVDVEATLTIIAILRYKQDTGGYPQNLQELIADAYLKQLPIDPYSNEPLVYRRTDEGFTLYSLGPNFTDDGGEYGKDRKGKPRLWYSLDGDAVFWPVPKLQLKQ